MKQDQPRRSISIAASCAVAATLLVAVPGIGGSSAVADSTVAVQVGGRGGVPTDATAAVVNITATNAAAPGWAVAWPCNTTRPEASTVNFQPGQTTANSSIVKLDDNGQACIYTSATTDVIVDVSGAFNPGTDFNPLTPTRLLDTRPTPPPPPPTTAPPTTNPPGTQFVATFDNNTGLDAFRTGIFHRDNTLVTQTSWPADHDTNCGPPNTQRTITRGSDGWNYLCRNHLKKTSGLSRLLDRVALRTTAPPASLTTGGRTGGGFAMK